MSAASRLTEPIDVLVDRLQGDWRSIVEAWRVSAAGRSLIEQVDRRVAAGAVVYPAAVFRALELTPLSRTRVVILGQDPYHGDGQAEGLAFSVPPGVPMPPSLRNVFKELRRDLGGPAPAHGHLGAWASRGVLLLNSSLTVEAGAPGSHAKLGWQALTDDVISAVASDPAPKVFMLWGAHAQSKTALLGPPEAARHLVLQSNHPSPLAALRPPLPFMGCGHFGAAARFIAQHRDSRSAEEHQPGFFDLN
ncbi:MAG: uracil-DNA glycosylase [Burkholderiales bacterium PBB1]|nr:MAG: uracil-DNA glycosylase [Burkholderiales bacterium PBB1]